MEILGLSFARPNALWLLLALPVVLLLGWRLGASRRRLRPSALGLRALTVALLAVTLAQPLTSSGGDAGSTIFVVDRSRSLTEGSAGEVERWINDALDSAEGDDRAAVVTFGASPNLANAMSDPGDIGDDWQATGELDTEYTNIESALALARALPVGGSRRIVLVSDGGENLGSALNQVSQAAIDGTPIDVLPLAGVSGDDLRVEGISAPSAVWTGETVNILASVSTGSGGSGAVELIVDGVTLASQPATFQPGLNTFTFQAPDLTPGFHALSVRVSASGDTDRFLENNEVPLAVVVREAPKLLLVAPDGSDPGRLRGALERKGAIVTVTGPAGVSSRLSDLAVYDAFILDNVSAKSLTFDQLTGLQEVTRSLGKGLVVIGGGNSYGPGAYAGSVLEETLPVTVKVTDGRERQRVALLLIIDHSGSMSYDPLGGTSKIDMAKEAAKVAVSALADGDSVGILIFSDNQEWVVRMTTIEGQETRDQIGAAIDGIVAEGGTEIFPALQVGFDAIRTTEADVRHVVLLSDGKSRTGSNESYDKLVDEAVADRTTLSTIAIGDDAALDLLQRLADHGYGRYHFTERPEEIPRLTLQEAQSTGSQSIIRGAFQPIQTSPSPIMGDFRPEELPPFDGYDYAEAKPEAQVVLTSQRDDPLLAKWQYGLGRVVAWTGDDGADFAIDWNEWAGFDDFWANMIRWSLPDPEHRSIDVAVHRDGPEAVVNVTSVGQDGDYVDLAATTATVTGPDGAVTRDIPLYQAGPGQYQFRIAAPQTGSYRIDLTQQRGDETVTELAGFSMPPSPEMQPVSGAGALMSAIATRTGGRVLTLENPDDAFSADGLTGTPLRTYNQVWQIPLLLALATMLAELAVRFDFVNRVRAARGRI
ncbi:MAG: VWA domain-containing protein [Thermomicrobiales bacterium]|nr:VWA domain-containing protein [Thermomicrobiales bacterium]